MIPPTYVLCFIITLHLPCTTTRPALPMCTLQGHGTSIGPSEVLGRLRQVLSQGPIQKSGSVELPGLMAKVIFCFVYALIWPIQNASTPQKPKMWFTMQISGKKCPQRGSKTGNGVQRASEMDSPHKIGSRVMLSRAHGHFEKNTIFPIFPLVQDSDGSTNNILLKLMYYF